MAHQFAFVIITPHTIRKSRTGAILSRLLGRTSAELVAVQVIAPTDEMAESYAATITPATNADDEEIRQLIRDYIMQNFTPGSDGLPHRILLLIFRGDNAVADIRGIVGPMHISSATGETIRDTYGDLVRYPDGRVKYFEPAVLVADSAECVCQNLHLWLDFIRPQSALLDKVCAYEHPSKIEQTLVLIKPDSWGEKSSRPGAVIDMFSRTGLRIIAMKLCRLSVSQGLAFYGPVRDALKEKLALGVGNQAREILAEKLGLELDISINSVLADKIGIPYAEEQFERLIEFMTGTRPDHCAADRLEDPGTVRCLALVYEGEDAVRKIRAVLGPTDPTKAPGGTVRREFGSSVMINTGHASDSAENAKQEMAILKMRESNLEPIVRQALLASCS